MDPVRYQMSGGKDFIAMLGADLKGYDVPHQLVEQLYRDTGVRTNPLRGISFTANKFATETFMDEIALKRRPRPREVPARAQEHAARGQVVERVAEMANWGKERGPRPGLRFLDYSARRSPASPRCRSTAAADRSRCMSSGAPSTAASRCNRITWWRRPRAASSMGWACP